VEGERNKKGGREQWREMRREGVAREKTKSFRRGRRLEKEDVVVLEMDAGT
jgi:hypothetical protein